ncbi:hypothetical protein CY34DRAFT_797139 [Suillus luteus UH-Slu-Lm8-n1]|uniref:Mediator complex subunit 16 C-terminal domain-containing protein n=1 Tax=Suillus luteus UH-Slu-Lm8-n1 TaxID=930992 RepID=A0A0D0AGA6_9AGAM|nr:hypothetical protein CY34DRAFT_797139 [Suillus luteus UH-Slu-Lm8-n1]
MYPDVRNSPSKGKAKQVDAQTWHSHWWDFHPLADNLQRPVAWSSSSTIFTPHPSQPLILGRSFSTSKQFLVPSPDQILNNSAAYEPPNVITVSSNDHWLFAYFPGRDSDGVGCLWQRGFSIDKWNIKSCWACERGAGIVNAVFVGAEREWVTCPDGSTNRLTQSGPLTPVSNPTLLTVTQAHQLNVYFLRTYGLGIKSLTCTLVQPSYTVENMNQVANDPPRGPKTSRLCSAASFGFIFNDPVCMVAMRSRRYPLSDTLRAASDTSHDLGLSLDMSVDSQLDERPPLLDWNSYEEEQMIELCEVKLRFDGLSMFVIAAPLPPIYHPGPCLTSFVFVSVPGSRPDTLTSPKASPAKDKQPQRGQLELPTAYLVASFLNFEEYASLPKSCVVAYSILKAVPPNGKILWTTRLVGERSLSPRILTVAAPGSLSIATRKATVVVATTNPGGSLARGATKPKEVPVGNLFALQLPDLSDDPDCDHPSILAPVNRTSSYCPLSMFPSPNKLLACAVSMQQTSVYTLPRAHITSGSKDTLHQSPLAQALTIALQSRRSTADISHILSLPSTPATMLHDTLFGTLTSYDVNTRLGSTNTFSMVDMMGAAVEIYRARARQTQNDDEKERYSMLSRNALNVCSVSACLAAFEDCKESEGYDLEPVWQLISLSTWVVAFLEDLMKECVFLADLADPTPNTGINSNEVMPKEEPMDDNPFLRNWLASPIPQATNQSPHSVSLSAPILLHLVHPFALTNLRAVVFHVSSFHQYLASMTAKRENSQFARNTMLDLVSSSGLDLKVIEEILSTAIPEASAIPAEEVMTSFAEGHPVPAQYEQLKKIIHSLTTSSAIDKPRLFIKSSDLVDGFANLSASDRPVGDDPGIDVVTKERLLTQNPRLLCLRCGGRSQVGSEVTVAGRSSPRWKTWERMWAARCICGGSWVSGNL